MEFIRAAGVATKQLYIYDGVKIDPNRYNGWSWENIRNDHTYGTESNPKIWVMREFRNSEANHLGMPLPKGRVRFYRRNDDGQIEFTGENVIDHTPHDETVRIYTGNAFDLTGERTPHQLLHGQRQTQRHRVIRNQSPQPQERAGRCPRRRTSLSRQELGYRVQVRRLQEKRQPHHRVPGQDRARWRKDNHLYSALHLVDRGGVPPITPRHPRLWYKFLWS